MDESRWIDLDGAVNVRDLGGLPTRDGGRTARGRLIRSDNLQDLSERDVAVLVEQIGVRAVADLRTGAEVQAEGPGPLHRHPAVEVRHLSLFPEVGRRTDAAADDEAADEIAERAGDEAGDSGPPVLPWQERPWTPGHAGLAGVYLNYLVDRGDSAIEALRLIASSAPGATIVHCAAGKDRTGTVVALALAEVGVAPEHIVADYALSAQRIEAIYARLGASPTYAEDIRSRSVASHAPQAATMEHLLGLLDDRFGGAGGWLRSQGWDDADAAALRAALLED